MSTPAKEGPEVPGKKKGGLLSRMKTVLKRSDGSKRLSFSSKPSAATAGPSTTKPAEPTPAPIPEPETAQEDDIPSGVTKIMRSQIDADRARKLGERFAITVEPLSTGPDKQTYRIEKPIRMRIHRSCHRCNTTFGNNKICAQCEHTRCKQCPRYPAKKTEKKEKGPSTTSAPIVVGGIEPDTYYGLREQLILTKPNPKPNAQPLVRKKPMQRVRRTCHSCSSLFPPGIKTCATCQHIRCADCPRDPAKKKKYPDGYPGDAPSSNTSLPVKYNCHKCNKTFPPVPHPDSAEGIARRESAEPGPECVRCGHGLCGDCPRAPPGRVEPAPDPEVLRSVREKLAALSVGGSGA
ncbi:uncharacterized protein LY89DRAFT_399097 [Mollisia scopiformis]|uniref:Uncharacterized protein n=1 Tax=Mollisia scopiformis TaxID=149040 RepID=A0A132B3M3_MOLSC|nr:uncharacterized protein LY89DRAFT_399097 [Mollisia scopiformis]KUJ06853.1 hypothetical protein LY89DRAFT_399097 [Mollisia scopiformis]